MVLDIGFTINYGSSGYIQVTAASGYATMGTLFVVGANPSYFSLTNQQ